MSTEEKPEVVIKMSVEDARKLSLTLETCFKNEKSYSTVEIAVFKKLYDSLMGINVNKKK